MIRKQPQPLPVIGIDEIPTAPSVFKARIVAMATLAIALLAIPVWYWGQDVINSYLSDKGPLLILWQKGGIDKMLVIALRGIGGLGALCLVAGGLALFLRNRGTETLLKLTLWSVTIGSLAYAWLTWNASHAGANAGVEIEGLDQDQVNAFYAWWDMTWPALAIGLYASWLKVMMRSRSVHAAFTGQQGNPMVGDAMLENLRTHGHDPRHRRCLYWSFFTHLFFIVILPWLLGLFGTVEAYKVPKGSGNPVVAMVKMVKPKKKKKKTLSLRPNSAIIYDQPDLDNTEVDQVMEEKTQLTYEASNNAKAGKMGKGGGDKGGWPEGMDDYKIRFIRLEHGGAGWDDGMDQSGADINFLRAFAQATGFKKIANKGESHSIALLSKYPDDGFPPFVYMTGNGNMGGITSGDVRALREYCLKGGMLIGDAGSAAFHNSFTHFMRQVFPDKPLVDISDDDMIYQLPYAFPNGAPAFWHHGGRRALGIKHEGRWIVFYHPGDMNDAWKMQGYTDVSPEMREAAMNLGINLVYYSFNQWDDAIAKAKKNQKSDSEE
ncbi:MAG TPA: DUF4159 domain-containing protein [Luteolibacter sp.]|nr:DUF4159 domain-containing protein [Luteolibacter sp.]